MAKMFYTLEEAAAKLGKSEDEIRSMAQSGRVQEFRDRDKLMFKVDQVDLLADEDGLGGGDAADMSGVIPLADSVSGGTGIGLGESAMGGADLRLDTGGGTGFAMEDSGADSIGETDTKQKTGVSIFDADELDNADPSAVTQISDGGLDDLTLEPVGSGSGLLDLTRESDDTSLGAVDFLEDLASADEGGGGAAPSGLFESMGEETASPGVGMVMAPGVGMVAAEPFDGSGSGLVGGLALGATVALGLGVTVVLLGVIGAGEAGVTSTLAKHLWIVIGGMAGLTLVGAGLGFVLGRRG